LNPFGVCMLVLDDIDPSSAIASGLMPLIQDVYHLIITERGTLPTDAEFGFGLSDLILSALDPDQLPALADQIETTLSEDDRIAQATVQFRADGDVVSMVVRVVAATTPRTGFELVGTVGALKATILSNATGLAA
jgi:hypothetical protein